MRLFRYMIFCVVVSIYSTLTFAQLDSVYYQGPLEGIVNSGAIQTTDNFSAEELPPGEPRVIPLVKGLDDGPLIINNGIEPTAEHIYIEDKSVSGLLEGGNNQTILLQKFPGIPQTNFIPPDPTLAVGPNHIIACANDLIRIFDKSGNLLKIISAASWWAPVSPYENGDPQVIYDHYSHRWVLLWLEVNNPTLTAGDLVAYSDDDNPLGTWYMYRLPFNNEWGDYPKMGYDEDAIYLMSRQITFTSQYKYNLIRILNKTEFYSSNAGQLSFNDLYNIRTPGQGAGGQALDVIHPAISYTPGSGAWFFWARGSIGGTGSANFYAVYKITNPLTTPGIKGKVLTVPTYVTPPNANQLGGGTPLETVGWINRAPVVRDGFLYVAHDIRNTTNSSYSSISYLKVDLNTASLTENIEFGNAGYFYLYPGLTVDKDNNIAFSFSRSADTEYAGAYYAVKYADSSGLSQSYPIQEGLGNYVGSTSRNRWGDYVGIYIDPDNDYDVWSLTEYAAASNTWGTYIAQIRMAPYSGAHAYLSPVSLDFSDVEVGTTSQNNSIIIANYGDSDLEISIPSSFNEFNLESSVSFPYTIASYDSLMLEFSFSPSVIGNVFAEYSVDSNDPNFTSINMGGNGYKMFPALDKTFYASSGSQNYGQILTIDDTTGAGTIVGESLFDEVTGITINPTNNIMYGLVSHSGNADIVRVSAAGDAYLLFNINIPQMSDIAFDTSGTLYGITTSGEVYTIDITNGTYNFIVDAAGSYSGIAFNPQTNELWATSRAFIPPNNDAIFKVNLTTGDTLIIGHTGLGKLTNDIVFDNNSMLFGVIGSSSENSDFISIDKASGVGTIVGSVGYKHLLGLAYGETGVTSVNENIQNSVVPTEYSLMQNYPNPFNPSTKIEFALPVQSDVQLNIYNILGQKVKTLFEGELEAGNHSFTWNADDVNGKKLSSGIYFYEVKADGIDGKKFHDIKKMLFLK